MITSGTLRLNKLKTNTSIAQVVLVNDKVWGVKRWYILPNDY